MVRWTRGAMTKRHVMCERGRRAQRVPPFVRWTRGATKGPRVAQSYILHAVSFVFILLRTRGVRCVMRETGDEKARIVHGVWGVVCAAFAASSHRRMALLGMGSSYFSRATRRVRKCLLPRPLRVTPSRTIAHAALLASSRASATTTTSARRSPSGCSPRSTSTATAASRSKTLRSA